MSSLQDQDFLDENALEKYVAQQVAQALKDYVNGTEAPEEIKGHCHMNPDQFPCSEDPITLVSMGLAAAALGLVMVIFLMQRVRKILLMAIP